MKYISDIILIILIIAGIWLGVVMSARYLSNLRVEAIEYNPKDPK